MFDKTDFRHLEAVEIWGEQTYLDRVSRYDSAHPIIQEQAGQIMKKLRQSLGSEVLSGSKWFITQWYNMVQPK